MAYATLFIALEQHIESCYILVCLPSRLPIFRYTTCRFRTKMQYQYSYIYMIVHTLHRWSWYLSTTFIYSIYTHTHIYMIDFIVVFLVCNKSEINKYNKTWIINMCQSKRFFIQNSTKSMITWSHMILFQWLAMPHLGVFNLLRKHQSQ